jgi:hypothetical protein
MAQLSSANIDAKEVGYGIGQYRFKLNALSCALPSKNKA